jgi:ABC-type dipeptide/oligopeptide/nickel transport system permease component
MRADTILAELVNFVAARRRFQRGVEVFAIGFLVTWIVGAVLAIERAAWSSSIGGKGLAFVFWLYAGWIPSFLIALVFAGVAGLVCSDVAPPAPLGPAPETDDDVIAMQQMTDIESR